MAEPIECVVVHGSKAARCGDCGRPLNLFRLRVEAPKRCRGMLLWAIPTHNDSNDAPCPGRSHKPIVD
jgi:hypothetical protein